MIFSRKDATLEDVRPLQIHGSMYFDIVYRYREPADSRAENARIGAEMIYPNAQPGDVVMVEKVANTVMRVERL